jgi:hypothetical protein
MTRPYRPSNGTEGQDFIDAFCSHCKRDASRDCPIVAATFLYAADDPRYPKEWVQDEVGARCTAFERVPE